jgi:hypothetical protein
MKKVILIVIDSCSSNIIVPAMESSLLPNMQEMAEIGSFSPSCISIFPSITHAATASIATGCYPQEHGIAGAHWYSLDSDDPVYYAGDFWVILNRGLGEFFEDFVVRLNHRWLKADTIFQTVERAGLKAACINHIIFRGDVRHELNIPNLLTFLPGVPSSETVYGPTILCMGDFISAVPDPLAEVLTAAGGLLHRFGLGDDYTADVLIELAKNRALPDFTLAYFPENDDVSHRLGPKEAVDALIYVDKRLGELFEIYGGLESMLEEFALLLIGDHSQSDVLADKENVGISLDQVLAEFSVAEVGQLWNAEDQLMACPNLRMAQIYLRPSTLPQFEHIVAELLNDQRVDQVLWRANFVEPSKRGYHVVTADRGALHFWPGLEGTETAVDQQGNAWSWQGDLRSVNGQLTVDNMLIFPEYPNAFERIKGGLECPTAGHLWVTARPGYEFSLPNMWTHTGGGSHGSLHVSDSMVPLIMAGAPAGIELPAYPRIVDVVPLCLAILELNSQKEAKKIQ